MDVEKALTLIGIGSALFDIIEKRDFSYRISRRLIKSFLFDDEIVVERVKNQLEQIIPTVDSWIDYEEQHRILIKEFIKENLIDKLVRKVNLGMSLAVFLLSWNMKRFSSYVKNQTESNGVSAKEDFKGFLLCYFNRINEIQQCIESFELSRKKIIEIDFNNDNFQLIEFLKCINNKLKVQRCKGSKGMNNEFVGTFKVSHILYPNLFIPLDNPIAKNLRIWENRWLNLNEKFAKYLKYHSEIKQLIMNLEITNLWETKEEYSILKKIDELFYMMFSTPRKKAVVIGDIFGLIHEDGE